MFHTTFRKIISIFLTGIVVKMMDDYIDQDYDALVNKNTFIKTVDFGVLPYSVFVFSLACILDLYTSISLFFASFIIGMSTNLTAKMPTGLYGYQESLVAFLVSLFLFNKTNMFSSIFVITAIQLLDDYIDLNKELFSKKNMAFLLGKLECLIIGIIFFLAALYLDFVKALASVLSTIIIVYINKLL